MAFQFCAVARALFNLNDYCRTLFSDLDEKDVDLMGHCPFHLLKIKKKKLPFLLRSVYRHVRIIVKSN